MKKFLNWISGVFTGVVMVFAVCMMIFTIFSVNIFDRTERNVMGYRFFVVMSDSMTRSNIHAGDIVIAKEVDASTLQPGDIISYTSTVTESYGETVTHQIRELTTDENGNPGFITFGTTTGVDDAKVVTHPYVIGKCVGKLAKVGKFFQFLKTTPGYIACILVPFLLLIVYQGFKTVKLFRQYKREQQQELDAERQKIEEERRQSMELMKELQALKQQLAQKGNEPPQEG